MVHDQLVDYISSQMKLGVSREAISSALVSAGWVAADVEDTIKKVESTKPAQPAAAASSMSSGTSSAMSSAKPMGTGAMSSSPMGAGTTAKPAAMSTGAMAAPATTATATATAMKPMGAAGPQVIKVSDLVSTTPGATVNAANPAKVDPGKFGGKVTGNSFQATTATAAPKKGGSGMKIVAIVLVLIFAAAAGYFYWQNTTLAAKISSLTGSSSQVNSQLTDLQTKLNTTNSDLSNQISALKQANDDLTLQLSFFAASKNATTTQATISGTLANGNAKDPYKITTPRSVDIYITSATAAKILTTLKSLVGGQVQVAGTYIPGSDQLTVTSILLPVQPVAAAATSTATSTTGSTTKASSSPAGY